MADSLSAVDDIARRIDEVLKARRWSAREWSRRAGLEEVHIGKMLERGGARVGGEYLGRMAKAAGISIGWLIYGEGPRDTDTRTEYTDAFPARTDALTPFRSSTDPDMLEAIALVSSASYEGAQGWTVERWTRALLQEVERVRWKHEKPNEAASERAASDARVRAALERPSVGAIVDAVKKRGKKPAR